MSSFDPTSDARFTQAVHRFAEIHAEDPNIELENGVPRPRALVETERLVRWVDRLSSNASEALRLAAHCQHVARFRVPRSSYPDGRIGYLKWRTELGRFHADTAARVLGDLGYEAPTIEAVRRIVQKQGITLHADVQTMEDALCLSFLEHEFSRFSEKHADDKLVDILIKTWRKMSPAARAVALELPLDARARALVERALSGG